MLFLLSFYFINFFIFLTENCDLKISFCVDTSSSLSNTNFAKEKSFLAQVYETISQQSEDFVAATAFAFADNIEQNFGYSNYSLTEEVILALNAIKRVKDPYSTHIGGCMSEVYKYDLTITDHTSKILIVVTDGQASRNDNPKAKDMSESMLDSGYTIFSVGFGDSLESGLLDITGGHADRVLYEEHVGDLAGSINLIFDDICNKITTCVEPPQIAPNTSADVSMCADAAVMVECHFECLNQSDNEKPNSLPVCLHDGSWTEKAICTHLDVCQNPPKVQSGTHLIFHNCRNVKVGVECKFSCLDNDKEESTKPVCLEGGNWSKKAMCSTVLVPIKSCHDPPIIENNAKVNVSMCENAIVLSICDFDCLIKGATKNSTPICQTDGYWSESASCAFGNNWEKIRWIALGGSAGIIAGGIIIGVIACCNLGFSAGGGIFEEFV